MGNRHRPRQAHDHGLTAQAGRTVPRHPDPVEHFGTKRNSFSAVPRSTRRVEPSCSPAPGARLQLSTQHSALRASVPCPSPCPTCHNGTATGATCDFFHNVIPLIDLRGNSLPSRRPSVTRVRHLTTAEHCRTYATPCPKMSQNVPHFGVVTFINILRAPRKGIIVQREVIPARAKHRSTWACPPKIVFRKSR